MALVVPRHGSEAERGTRQRKGCQPETRRERERKARRTKTVTTPKKKQDRGRNEDGKSMERGNSRESRESSSLLLGG